MKWTQFTVFLKKDVYFSNWNDSFFEFKFLAFFYIFSILYLISLKKYATHFVRQRRSPEILNKNICPAFCHINNDLVIWKTRAKMKGRKRNKGRKLWKKYRVNKKHSFLLFIHSFMYFFLSCCLATRWPQCSLRLFDCRPVGHWELCDKVGSPRPTEPRSNFWTRILPILK